MKDLDPLVFYYVFIEMMGPLLFWFLVLLALGGLALDHLRRRARGNL